MSGGFSIPFAGLAAFADNKYAQVIFVALAFAASWFAAYTIWKAEGEKVADFEENLRPKIKVLGVHEHHDFESASYLFDLEINNDSGTSLDNCLAKVTDLHLFKREADGRLTDYSDLYKSDLPWALRTARNVQRDGGGPFNLRAGEPRKYPFCLIGRATRV